MGSVLVCVMACCTPNVEEFDLMDKPNSSFSFRKLCVEVHVFCRFLPGSPGFLQNMMVGGSVELNRP